jgi:hypothetical protein
MLQTLASGTSFIENGSQFEGSFLRTKRLRLHVIWIFDRLVKQRGLADPENHGHRAKSPANSDGGDFEGRKTVSFVVREMREPL